jgi:hypothetical protein
MANCRDLQEEFFLGEVVAPPETEAEAKPGSPSPPPSLQQQIYIWDVMLSSSVASVSYVQVTHPPT